MAKPSIVGEDLLVIAKEFSGFDGTAERADIAAMDAEGDVVVIELKRDDTGANVHWQVIKYASYFQRATPKDIVEMLAAHRLLQHLQADDLENLNRDHRIILASHRFAPEVTLAVLWLNEKAVRQDFITCVQIDTLWRPGEQLPIYSVFHNLTRARHRGVCCKVWCA